jgi:6-phosphogluconolactonase
VTSLPSPQPTSPQPTSWHPWSNTIQGVECRTSADVARIAAQRISFFATQAVERKGAFSFAVSGGQTPWEMLERLAEQPFPWAQTTIYQVDERIAPDGDDARNLTHLQRCLAGMPTTIVPMPVTHHRLQQAALDYERSLPPVIDLIHLGLGADGHTASLIPGDPILDKVDERVAITSFPYQGHRRMSMTLPTINTAMNVLWVVSGSEKATALTKLLATDPSIPAGRVRAHGMFLVADIAALA